METGTPAPGIRQKDGDLRAFLRKWTPLLVAMLLLAGLAPAALAGDQVGKPELQPGPAADRVIQSTLTAVFARVSEFKGIKAQVSQGVVVLSGDTASFAANQKAVDMAAKIAGVVYVVDHIAVEAHVGSYIA
ncbi:MAG: BON domain-containing protein, partial [Desulfarculaceae bacterium]|nr:BON domain-containing protein [Desulfarculaceae bacterium]